MNLFEQSRTAADAATAADGPELALDGLLAELGIQRGESGGEVTIQGQDPLTPSVHRIGEAAAAALAALGVEAATLWRERGGSGQDITVSVARAIDQLMAIFLTRCAGVGMQSHMEDPNLLGNSDFYCAADGRFVYVLLSYPQLRDIACEVLDCAPSRRAMSEAVARRDAEELAEAINARGGTAAVARSQAEWRAHPQGVALAETPLIAIERVGDSEPVAFTSLAADDTTGPLGGLRVLDNTHVIAGPMAARLAAELGADVLHISSPAHPDPNGMIIETGIGKRSAFCDLTDPAQAARFWELLDSADLYVSNYMDLDTKGFGAAELARRRPGLIVLDYHGWGERGPWARRGGFDQLACAATGFSIEEGTAEAPSLPPTYLLNDYLAAILGAAGAIEALRRRARDGGSYRVHLDLARICMWVQDLGLLERADVADLPAPAPEHSPAPLLHMNSPFGPLTYLPTQINYSAMTPRLRRPPEPLGAAPLAWF